MIDYREELRQVWKQSETRREKAVYDTEGITEQPQDMLGTMPIVDHQKRDRRLKEEDYWKSWLEQEKSKIAIT
jgi:hypothetical protein